jgi:hypothetical protein
MGSTINNNVNQKQTVYKAQSEAKETVFISDIKKALEKSRTEEEKLASTLPGGNSFKQEEISPKSNNNSSDTSNHEWSNCLHCQQAASQSKTKDEEIS